MSRNTTTLRLITNCKQSVFIINIIFPFSPPQGFVWFIKGIHSYVITFLFNACFIDFFVRIWYFINSSNYHDWFWLPLGIVFWKILYCITFQIYTYFYITCLFLSWIDIEYLNVSHLVLIVQLSDLIWNSDWMLFKTQNRILILDTTRFLTYFLIGQKMHISSNWRY